MAEQLFGMSHIEDDMVGTPAADYVVGNEYFVKGAKYQLVSMNQEFELEVVGAPYYAVWFFRRFEASLEAMYSPTNALYNSWDEYILAMQGTGPMAAPQLRWGAPTTMVVWFNAFSDGTNDLTENLGGSYFEPKKIRIAEDSGVNWAERFHGNRSLSSLNNTFEPRVRRFIAALEDAGIVVTVTCCRRSRATSFLMHYAWRIARPDECPPQFPGVDPRKVPKYFFEGDEELAIGWSHYNAAGEFLEQQSRVSASEMVTKWGQVHFAALSSTHNTGDAVDMTIGWTADTVNVADFNGVIVPIGDGPRDGTNATLAKIGASYEVYKLSGPDKPHWQSTP
jgi:hypothetical protein